MDVPTGLDILIAAFWFMLGTATGTGVTLVLCILEHRPRSGRPYVPTAVEIERWHRRLP